MGKAFVVSCLFLITSVLCSYSTVQAVPLTPTITRVHGSGEDSARYVWVIVSEGYTSAEQSAFREDAESLVSGMLAQTPFAEFSSAFNIYTLFVASEMSGADFPPEVYVDTAFDASFVSAGMDRLLTVNEAAVFSAVATAVPHFDLVIALVNDEHYGGSGGSVIAVSVHEHMHEIALHEAGHVIAGLADEYSAPYPGYPPGDDEPNVTFQSELSNIPWKSWIDPATPVPTPEWHDEEIGLFEGARYYSTGIYRPTFDSKMRRLGKPFYAVNTQALVVGFYRSVELITGCYPQQSEIVLEPATPVELHITTIHHQKAGWCDVLWMIDEEVIEHEDGMEMTFTPSALPAGEHRVTVRVRDDSGMVLADPMDVTISEHTWVVTKSFCSGALRVTCKDEKTRRPVKNATVRITGVDEAERSGSDEGDYLFEDSACGLYTVTAAAAGYKTAHCTVAVADGTETQKVLMLEPSDGAFYICCTILGEPPRNGVIEITGSYTCSTAIDGIGAYRVGPVVSGTYTVTPRQSGIIFFPHSRRITIKDKDSTRVYFLAFPDMLPGGTGE